MRIQRITSLLQTMADTRRWLRMHLPEADSAIGHDLFLRVASDYFNSRPLVAEELTATLGHPEAEVAQQLALLQAAGLLAERSINGVPHLVPTKRFAALLEQYEKKFESMFILRSKLREEQLEIRTSDARLGELAGSLYDHFYDLGWLYLHNFGSICYTMADLTRRIAQAWGHEARVLACHAEFTRPHHATFKLGAPGIAGPGQIDGHAVCIIDNAALVDFGLGSVRRQYRRAFPWGLACDYVPVGDEAGRMQLQDGHTMCWKVDWQSPKVASELERCSRMIDELFGIYQRYYAV